MPQDDLWREDFWRMIIQEQVPIIVMLNREHENQNQAYWPENATSIQYGCIQLRILSSSRFGDATVVRTFEATNSVTNNSQLVKHFQMIDWPDEAIPTDIEEFIKFVQSVREEQRICEKADELKRGPILVHCYAGKGRTGSMLTILINLEDVLDEGKKMDIGRALSLIRYDRACLVSNIVIFLILFPQSFSTSLFHDPTLFLFSTF